LEWLYRLSREPKRLWRRYLTQNPRFVVGFARQYVRARKDISPGAHPDGHTLKGAGRQAGERR